MTWFSITSVILFAAGIFFGIFGLGTMPVERDVLVKFESAIYSTIMMGWGTTIFFAGRLAFKRNDTALMKVILYGLSVWLLCEALVSAYLKVWFNIGVDLAVLFVLSFPLIKALSQNKK